MPNSADQRILIRAAALRGMSIASWLMLSVATADAVAKSASASSVGLSPAIESVPDTLIVRFRARSTVAQRAATHAAMGSTRVRTFDVIPADVVRVAPGTDRDAVAARYAARADVAYVQPDFVYTVDAAPNDARFNRQWSLENRGAAGWVADADIDAPDAWDRETGDRSVIVAVIDTGIDYTHADLRDNMWTNEIERTGVANVDDDSNGIVDDIYGARFTDRTGMPTNGDPFDGLFHGTHVAGIIGATGNNDVGIAGVAHAVRLMAVKVFDNYGRGVTSDAIAGIEYALAHGAHIINNSWGGGGYDQALRDAIETAGEAGQLCVASAGNGGSSAVPDNDSYPRYPASFTSPTIIAVASTTQTDELSFFSSFGAVSVDLAAPGSEIYSTEPGSSYGLKNGTSMAAPHVSGVAALLMARVPGARPLEVKQWILDGTDPIPALAGLVATGGRLNANNALALANPSAGRVLFGREQYSWR